MRNGSLGKLELVTGWLSQDWMRPTAGSWRQKPELSGGGQAYDSGAHLLNSVCWSPVESDIALVFACLDNKGTPVDINSAITIRFANGVLGNIVVGGNCRSSGCNLTYCFENGRIDVDGWGGNWIRVYERDQVKYPVIPGKAQSPNDNFVDAILGRAQPCTSPRNGIVQSELMDAIYESARTGQPAKPKRAAAARRTGEAAGSPGCGHPAVAPAAGAGSVRPCASSRCWRSPAPCPPPSPRACCWAMAR
ncbi:MAG: Gfo/Idh/MocA family oxidoreductase [Paludibaculum sp.]